MTNSRQDQETAFDAFDDASVEKGSPTYGHAAVGAGYGKRTGGRVAALALIAMAGLGGAFLAATAIRAREAASLEEKTKAALGAKPAVNVAEVKPAPPAKTLSLPAETAPWYRTTIYSRVSGYLADWKVDIGDHVTKGQVLALIDTPDLDAQLEAAKAELKAAEAESAVRQSDADFANTSYDRWRESPKGVVSDQEREAKKAAAESAAAQLKVAEAKVAVAKAKVDGLATLTGYKSVTAPFDGIVTERRVDPGDLVTAGSTANTTPLFVIQQADRIRIMASLPQAVAEQVSVGSPVRVLMQSSDSTKVVGGKVSRITGALDPHARTMRIEVTLQDAAPGLAPGMYVRAEFNVALSAGLEIPASALVFRGKDPEVAVVERTGKISFRKVAILSDEGDRVVLGSGVSAGEHVALNLSSQISEGDAVDVRSSDEAQS